MLFHISALLHCMVINVLWLSEDQATQPVHFSDNNMTCDPYFTTHKGCIIPQQYIGVGKQQSSFDWNLVGILILLLHE